MAPSSESKRPENAEIERNKSILKRDEEAPQQNILTKCVSVLVSAPSRASVGGQQGSSETRRMDSPRKMRDVSMGASSPRELSESAFNVCPGLSSNPPGLSFPV